MTQRLPFTEASVRRRINAARKAGLHVLGIGPDGTVIVGDNPNANIQIVPPQAETARSSKWEDVEA